jgi:RND family efflux transporter MFP subunit
MPDDSAADDPAFRRRVHRTLWILAALAVGLALWGVFSRVLARAALRREAAVSAVLTLTTVKPGLSATGEELVLPGTTAAFIEAPIYARTSGYLKAWYTDIGSHVHRGQLLAEIESPEIDRQLAQAEADLATARANQALAASTDARWRGLLATDSVSKQDAEEKAGDAAAKAAAADSAAANVARLRELTSFKRVLAPFDGVVTARNTDIGALINAGQTAGAELFRVADTHKLRIYAQVPEAYAPFTKAGLAAELFFSSHPDKPLAAQTVRTANALDPVARTLQVELELDNSGGEIFPGSYAEVHFKLPVNAASLRLPANTVLFRTAGLQVATVDADSRIHLKSIREGRDFGTSIEVLGGLEPSDVVVMNPPDSLIEGAPVRIVAGRAP